MCCVRANFAKRGLRSIPWSTVSSIAAARCVGRSWPESGAVDAKLRIRRITEDKFAALEMLRQRGRHHRRRTLPQFSSGERDGRCVRVRESSSYQARTASAPTTHVMGRLLLLLDRQPELRHRALRALGSVRPFARGPRVHVGATSAGNLAAKLER